MADNEPPAQLEAEAQRGEPRLIDMQRPERRRRMAQILLSVAAKAAQKGDLTSAVSALKRSDELMEAFDIDLDEANPEWAPDIVIVPIARGNFLPMGGVPPLEWPAEPEQVSAHVAAHLVARPENPYRALDRQLNKLEAQVDPAHLPAPEPPEPPGSEPAEKMLGIHTFRHPGKPW